jgi:hypothetical protein
MYDSRKTKRKKGGQPKWKDFKALGSRVGIRMANRVSSVKQAVTKTVKKAASNLKSDRLTALMKGTNTQTFCCDKSEDSHKSTFFLSNEKQIGLNLFGKNNGTDCKPVWSGLCNSRGKYTHKYRCFDAKYYPMPSDIPDKFPVFPEKAPVFGDDLFKKLKKGIDGEFYNKASIDVAKQISDDLQSDYNNLMKDYKNIQEYFEKYKDVLRIPSLEQFKNSQKSANTEWYSLITDNKGRKKKIKDVNKKVIATMLKQLTSYGKDISLKQIGLRCETKSIELYGKFGQTPVKDKYINPKDIVTRLDDKDELITTEDEGTVKTYKQPKDNTDKTKRVLIYTFFKVEPEITTIQDGLITQYVRNLQLFIDTLHAFINGSRKRKKFSRDMSGIQGISSRYGSYILMGNYMNYENALNDHLLEVAPMLDNIIEYQGYRDNYMRRMVRYIALVKSYVDNPANQGNTISDALYYGLYNNIYERNYNDSNPYQKTCQHISKLETKVVKVSSEVTRLSLKILGISALVGIIAVGTAVVITFSPVLVPLALMKLNNVAEASVLFDGMPMKLDRPTFNTMSENGMFADYLRISLVGPLGMLYPENNGGKNRTRRRRQISLRKYK